MVASGQLEDYSQSIEIVIPSVINLTEAEAALNASIDTNLETLNLATEAYESYGLAITSAAADQAIANAEFRLVNPAVSSAVDSMTEYVDVMGEVQGEFQTTDMIADRLTASIRDQASAFDDLRGDVESAEISLDDIDETFNRIPDAIDLSIVSMEDLRRWACERCEA